MSFAPSDGLAGNLFLAGVAIFFAVVIGLELYRRFTLHRHWAARIGGLLEHDGFRVRHMERRWLTRGPFQDLRAPGLKHYKEWLVRVVADDPRGLPRAGWVRWRLKWPWEKADTWAVRWDEEPWAGVWPEGRGKSGLSSRLFLLPLLAVSLAGAVAGMFMLRSMFRVYDPPAHPATGQAVRTPGSSQASLVAFELRCRGGNETNRIKHIESRQESTGALKVVLSLDFSASKLAAGADGSGLSPGTCSWVDRPLNEYEPRVIRFEATAIRKPDMPHFLIPAPGTIPTDDDVRDSARYWHFHAVNANQGFLMATGPVLR